MELVIGGKYQGKYQYVIEHMQSNEKKVFNNLDELILESMKNKLQDKEKIRNQKQWMEDFVEEIMIKLSPYQKDGVIICNEVGCGLVPMKFEERLYRDLVGEICCRLASKSKRVIRVICGIGVKIKDDDYKTN